MSVRAFGFGCNCDVCDRFFHSPAIDDDYLRKDFALHGWERGEIDLCKTCVEKRDAGHEGIQLLIEQARKKKAATAAEKPARG